jgi:DNA-binding response OmpR family regulator
VNHSIGIITANGELYDDLKQNIPDAVFEHCKTIDSIKISNQSLILVDCDLFSSENNNSDDIQFHLSRIRKKIQDIPVILIMRVNNVAILQKDWFMDDFILYPFRKNELAARIFRLSRDSENSEHLLSIGNIHINLNEYSVYMGNEKLDLTYKEFELLRLFVTNPGTVFSRKDLLNKIWGVEYIGGTRTVDVHIRRLRGKLGEGFNHIIETVRNVGYRCREQ